MTIQAIETRYAGCRFRSRLEARWAVFFDHLKIRWEYEPEGYELFSGRYLPDFKLPDTNARGCWFEVKPGHQLGDDPRWNDLATVTGMPVYVAKGMPRPDRDVIWGAADHNGFIEMFDAGWDNGRAFCVCPVCDVVSIQFEGRFSRLCRHLDDSFTTADDPRILSAYDRANSARFEHGERP